MTVEISQAGHDAGNDEAITPQQLITQLINAIRSAGSQSKFASKYRVSQSLVSLTVTGKRGIDASVANALGYIKRVKVEYVPLQRGTNLPAFDRRADDTKQTPDMDHERPCPASGHSADNDLIPGGEPSPAHQPRFDNDHAWQQASRSSSGI